MFLIYYMEYFLIVKFSLTQNISKNMEDFMIEKINEKNETHVCEFCNKNVDIQKKFRIHNGQYCHIHCFADNIGYETWMNPKKKSLKKKVNNKEIKNQETDTDRNDI